MNEKENGVESRINQGKAKVLNAALYLIHLVVHHPQGNGRRLLMPNGYHLVQGKQHCLAVPITIERLA
jgi:hypothetical protein